LTEFFGRKSTGQRGKKEGVEIWGWEEIEQVEKIMLNYVRRIVGLEFCTP